MLNLMDDDCEKIYTDFNFDLEIDDSSFETKSEAPVKQGPWGIHAFKPIAQAKWENAVKSELENMIHDCHLDSLSYKINPLQFSF